MLLWWRKAGYATAGLHGAHLWLVVVKTISRYRPGDIVQVLYWKPAPMLHSQSKKSQAHRGLLACLPYELLSDAVSFTTGGEYEMMP